MTQLSSCVLTWNQEDYDLLLRAEVVHIVVRDPSDTAVHKAI